MAPPGPSLPKPRAMVNSVLTLATIVFRSMRAFFRFDGALRLPPGLLGLAWSVLAAASAMAADGSAQKPAVPPAAPAVSAEASDALQKERARSRSELKELSGEISLSKDRIAQLQASIASLGADQAELRQRLVDAAGRQKTLQRSLEADEDRLTALHAKADGIHANLMAKRGVLAQVLGALERMGRNPPPALLVRPDDALSSVRSAILLGAVVPGMRKETTALVDQLQALAGVERSIEAEKNRMKGTLTGIASEKKRISLLLQKKNSLQSESEQKLAAQQRRAEDLAGKANNLQDLISSLEDRIESIRQAEEQARLEEDKRRRQAEEALKQAQGHLAERVPDKNRIAPAYAFSDLKHKLDLPVAGEPVKQFGDDDGTGHPLQGMMVSTQPGALVTAPADGWVVYAGPFRSYGDLIILNVGDGYHVVLAGMSRMDVNQGQFVVAGEPVAEMGQTRLAGAAALALVSSQPTLYIEFRKGAKPVDPRIWWAENSSGRVNNGT